MTEFSSSEAANDAPLPSFNSPFAPLPLLDSPLVSLGLMFAIGLLAPFVPIPSIDAARLGAIALTFGYVWLVLRFVRAVTRQKLGPALLMMWCVACLIGFALLSFVVWPFLLQTFQSFAPNAVPLGWQIVGLFNFNARPLLLMSAATCGGAALSSIVRHANMIGPLCAVTALIDIWGVLFGGIVSQMMASKTTQPIAEQAMAQMPTLGASNSGFSVALPAVGAGDYLFLGLFFGVLYAHNLNVRGALNWVWPLISMALVLVSAGIPMLPGLLFIGLGVAIPNRHAFQFERDEKFALIWAGVFVAILTAVLYFVVVSQLETDSPQRTQRAQRKS